MTQKPDGGARPRRSGTRLRRSSKPRVNSGGRANEAGSVHRSAVSAYLAVHGLAERPLRALGMGAPTVTSLVLESDDAVDDVRCELSDGTVLVLQAKNECGAGNELRETLAQWVRQPLAELTASNCKRRVLVGVVAERFRGEITALPQALNRRRQPEPGVPSAPELRAITTVAHMLQVEGNVLGEVGCPEGVDRLLDVAYALLINATGSAAPQRGEASAWLEALCAGSGHGDAAFDALQRFFQSQASRGSGSTVEEWLTVLADAGHPAADDPLGLIGQRRTAERRALREYRSRLSAERDRLSLSPLAGPLAPMDVPDLLASFRVDVGKADDSAQRQSFSLAEIARRWGRLTVTGLPGAGKSCAIDQLAAAWAADDDAPTPVRARLRDMAGQVERGTDLTLDRIVTAAITASPESDRELLRPVLAGALRRGDGALLLDGLDECGGSAGVVADGITALADEFPSMGIIVTTRHSTSAEADKIGLPTVDLETPSSLQSTLSHLVRHAAPTHAHAADSAWTRARQAAVERASRFDRGLWSVPLLATLMTLEIVGQGQAAPTASRGRLMAKAVLESAGRWLRQEHALAPSRMHQLVPEMVVEGFAIIGHALAGGEVVRRSSVVTAISERLSRHWGKAPGEADALAGAVIDFWDRHVGAFLVESAERDAFIEPRAVHLVEIGDAMWVQWQDGGEQGRWVTSAMGHDNRQEAVVLAAGSSVEVLEELVDAVVSIPPAATRRRGLEWAAAAAADHQGRAREETYRRLIDALAREASADHAHAVTGQVMNDPLRHAREERDGPGWRWIMRLVSVPLPAALRDHRDKHLAAQLFSDEQRVVADALRSLTDALTDDRGTLPGATAQACAALLHLRLPDSDAGEKQVQRTSRRSMAVIPSGPRLLSGHADAVALLVRFPEVLDDEAVLAVHEIMWMTSMATWQAISTSLTAASLPVPRLIDRFMTGLVRDGADGEPYRWFLEGALACGTPRDLLRRSRWRLAELADVVGIIDIHIGKDFWLARDADAADVAFIVGAVADAHGLDRGVLAAQAHYVMGREAEESLSILPVVLTPRSPRERPRQPKGLPPSVSVERLLNLFDHPSAFLANAARDLLWATGDPAVGERLLTRASAMRARRRWSATVTGILMMEDPGAVAERLYESTDGPTRSGAVTAAANPTDESDTGATDLVTRSLEDPDFTVRRAAGATQGVALHAEYWSCPDCASHQPIDALDCSVCPSGARPGPHSSAASADAGVG